MTGIAELAAVAFEKQERVRILSMMNTPTDYEERKKAFIELALARDEANKALAALHAEASLVVIDPFAGRLAG